MASWVFLPSDILVINIKKLSQILASKITLKTSEKSANQLNCNTKNFRLKCEKICFETLIPEVKKKTLRQFSGKKIFRK